MFFFSIIAHFCSLGWVYMSNTPKPLRWTLFLPKASNRGIKCWRVDTYGSARLVISKVNPFHLKSIHKGFVLRSPRFCVFVLKTTTLETWKQHGWLLRRSCLFISSFTVLHFVGKNFLNLFGLYRLPRSMSVEIKRNLSVGSGIGWMATTLFSVKQRVCAICGIFS